MKICTKKVEEKEGLKSFEFYYDSKATIWERSYFTIVANNKEEALNQIKQNCNTPQEVSHFIHNADVYENETLYDTMEIMSVEANGGSPTIEIYDGYSDCLIAENRIS